MEIVRSIDTLREEWQSRSALVTKQRVVQGWQAPPEEIVKLNADATFFSQLKVANLRMVLRDHTGSILRNVVRRVGDVDSLFKHNFWPYSLGWRNAGVVLFNHLSSKVIHCLLLGD